MKHYIIWGGIGLLGLIGLSSGLFTAMGQVVGPPSPVPPPVPQIANFSYTTPEITVYENGAGSILLYITNSNSNTERVHRLLTVEEVIDYQSSISSRNTIIEELVAKSVLQLSTPPPSFTISQPLVSPSNQNIQNQINSLHGASPK